MSIPISEAIKIGDKKLRVVKSSAVATHIKHILRKQNIALNVTEIARELRKVVKSDSEYNALFATSDKTCIDKSGKVNALKVLQIRLNDIVYNSRKNTERIERTTPIQNGVVVKHYYYKKYDTLSEQASA